MKLEERARVHAALGDATRLLILDQLSLGDRTFGELVEVVGAPGNLLAHHLHVLEEARLIDRRVSEGDRRRRYITLHPHRLPAAPGTAMRRPGRVAFVCTRNSARSQFAAALWRERTGRPASSAGSNPADRVDPSAVAVAAERGIDLSAAATSDYGRLLPSPHLLVSVCDVARESGLPRAGLHLHWSVPDPVRIGRLAAFRSAFDEIEERMGRLIEAMQPE